MALKQPPSILRVFTLRNANHPLGLMGLAVMYLSGLLLLILLALNLFGLHASPYIGILTFLILPALFVLGIVLVVIGRLRAQRRLVPGEERPLHPFPQWDLNQPDQRARFVVLLVGGTLALALVATLSYRGVEYMESVSFCGTTCHTVMEPEHTAYLASPHARVACVDCHIGPGAGWFVRSKLSGLRQVWAVTANSYQRPIPTPIHNLRPARETCEQCHWPEKFHGDKVLVKQHYQEDEESSPLTNVLVLKVGGGGAESGFATGIHWHMSLANKVSYVSDEKREEIVWVRSESADGTVKEYVKDGFEPPADFPGELEMRGMDCMDCHNRPTHTFKMPDVALDEAIAAGRIARTLPYIKREAMAALTADYASVAEADAGIRERLAGFYAREYPDAGWSSSPELAGAIETAIAMVKGNVFPKMKVGWGTYPNHIGHTQSPGCFRCHDDEHRTAQGDVISQDCDNCHSLLAWEERDPEILRQLFP